MNLNTLKVQILKWNFNIEIFCVYLFFFSLLIAMRIWEQNFNMSSDGKVETTIIVNEDEIANLNIEDELPNPSDHGKIIRP